MSMISERITIELTWRELIDLINALDFSRRKHYSQQSEELFIKLRVEENAILRKHGKGVAPIKRLVKRP